MTVSLINTDNAFGQTMRPTERYELSYYMKKEEPYATDGVLYIRSNTIDLYQERTYVTSFKFNTIETITNQISANVKFQYDYYHIYDGNINRIVISKHAEVKHGAMFYYRVIIGNNTYLALKR